MLFRIMLFPLENKRRSSSRDIISEKASAVKFKLSRDVSEKITLLIGQVC
jgi:hypothetical protein